MICRCINLIRGIMDIASKAGDAPKNFYDSKSFFICSNSSWVIWPEA